MKLLIILFLFCSAWVHAEKPVQIIFDTDCGPDYDDVGAMATLFSLENQGKCNVLAVVTSNRHPYITPCVRVLNQYFNRGDVPTGELRNNGVSLTGWHKESWSKYLVDKYSRSISLLPPVDDATTLYRKTLAVAKNKSVVICTVGFLTNLANLLNSPPDQYSSLSGADLVKKKVKRWVAMAGGFPKGYEYNIREDAASSVIAFNQWPTPVYLCGFEVGDKVFTGKRTSEVVVANNPVAEVYKIALAQDNPKGRDSWDQVTTLAAINGTEPYFDLKRGEIVVFNDGSNKWINRKNGRFFYMIPKVSYESIANEIEQHMMYIPSEKN